MYDISAGVRRILNMLKYSLSMSAVFVDCVTRMGRGVGKLRMVLLVVECVN